MAKTFYTQGTGASQTTETADQPFIKYFTDETTAKAALSNLNIGDVISTHDEVSIENFVQDVVDAKDDALAAIGLAEGNAIGAMNNQLNNVEKPAMDSYAENLMGSYGNPVGSILALYTSTIPRGYLLCDGRDTTGTAEELQTVYPYLYAALGNSNVLPDLREMALVGVGENTTDTTTIHDTFTLGEFKDFQTSAHGHALAVETRATFNNVGVPVGVANTIRNVTTVTRGKRKGVNFIIKATVGIEEDNVINGLKSIVAASSDFADFQTRMAAWNI